jgi:pimeloyl-ACP methyl ester carboxylesterase
MRLFTTDWYGKSMAMRPVNYMEREAAVKELEILEIDNAILFGHSDGGAIELLMANKHPYRVKAVVCDCARVCRRSDAKRDSKGCRSL